MSVITTASAFPFVAKQPGIDTSLLQERQQTTTGPGSELTCPYNPNHVPAVAWNSKFPYNYASGGSIGKGQGGYQVPAVGDYNHRFIAPNPTTDIRGPCPGLNVAANHGFIARDGITTFTELTDALQNVYNVGYDLCLFLALLSLNLADGDIVTQKLSIGCDATSRTSFNVALTGNEPGLDGHQKFESDTSLTRNDYFLANGDDFSFNGTLFGMMTNTTGGLYNREGLGTYRYQRYQQSLANNPNFFFGPLTLFQYGAASFLYSLMPSGPNYIPDVATISSFFGTSKDSAGNWQFNNNEQIPANWTNRILPYTLLEVTGELVDMYLQHPVLLGGNTGNGSFDLLPTGNSTTGEDFLNAEQISCLIYQLLTESIPGSLNGLLGPLVEAITYILGVIGPEVENLGCTLALTK